MILEQKFNLKTFTHSATADRLKIDNTQMTDEQLANLLELHKLLLRVQARLSIKFARPVNIQINSGFRSEALNKAVGGVSTSDHCSGSAADTVAVGVKIEDYYSLLRELAKEKVLLFGQVILEYGKRPDRETDDWTHIALPRKGKMNDFMRSVISSKDGAKVDGKREYVKEAIV
jgi:hypothetical protein